MALYIKPPVGRLSLSTIESCAKARLQFLLKVARCHGNSADMQDVVMDAESVKIADCLTEGSAKDVVSHFLLRLACSADPILTSFFMNAEGTFFRYRVSRMTESELRTLVVTPLRTLGELLIYHQGPLPPAMAQVAEMLGYMTYTYDLDTIVHYFVEGRKDKFLVLQFEHVLSLIARRTVKVLRGKAIVPCTRLCDVLYVIFCKVLEHGMGLAKDQYPSVIEDSRSFRLFRQLKAIFYGRYHTLHAAPSMFGTVCTDDVNSITECLPLCMSNLHRVLRQRHRLKHADRIQYTLYLKELGMPVHEALQFWRLEYSQEVTCLKGDHDQNWYSNSRRYTYNIRHLYGLEGARTNYRGHSCAALQGRCLGSLEAGGCPFSNCDSAGLQNLLADAGLPVEEQGTIIDLASQHLPQHACQAYLGYKATTALSLPECLGCGEGICTNTGFTNPHVLKRKLKEDCNCGNSSPNKPLKMAKIDGNKLFIQKEEQEIKAECNMLTDVNAMVGFHGEYRSRELVAESMNVLPAKQCTNSDSCGTDYKCALLQQEVRSLCTCINTTLGPDSTKPFSHSGRQMETKVIPSVDYKPEMDVISCATTIKPDPDASANSTLDDQGSACLDSLPVQQMVNSGQMHGHANICRQCEGGTTMQPVQQINRQSKLGIISSYSTPAASSNQPMQILAASDQKMTGCIQASLTSTKPLPTQLSACSSSDSSSTSQQVSQSPADGAKSSSGQCVSCSMRQRVSEVRFLKPVDYSLSYQKLIKGLRE